MKKSQSIAIYFFVLSMCIGSSFAVRIDLTPDTLNIHTSGTQGNTILTRNYGPMSCTSNASSFNSLTITNSYAQTSTDNAAVYATCIGSNTWGMGVYGQGGRIGVYGKAIQSGGTGHYGGYFFASGATTTNYGVYASAGTGGTYRYGIYADAGGGSNNYAAYFNGSTYCTGSYGPSDIKLKMNPQLLDGQGTIRKIMLLKPQTYYYDTTTNTKMNLPSKKQYGLIAQELETVFPDMVTEITVPDTSSEAKKTPETFKAVNYTQMIAVLIAGMQEQQREIDSLKAILKK